METRGRKISSFTNLRVRGLVQFDNPPNVEGIALPVFKIFAAVVRTVGDGSDFFVAHFNTLGSDPTLVHEGAGVWTLRFANNTFTNYTVAIIATLDNHPAVTYDFQGSAWFRFRTLGSSGPADNQVSFIRVWILDLS